MNIKFLIGIVFIVLIYSACQFNDFKEKIDFANKELINKKLFAYLSPIHPELFLKKNGTYEISVNSWHTSIYGVNVTSYKEILRVNGLWKYIDGQIKLDKKNIFPTEDGDGPTFLQFDSLLEIDIKSQSILLKETRLSSLKFHIYRGYNKDQGISELESASDLFYGRRESDLDVFNYWTHSLKDKY